MAPAPPAQHQQQHTQQHAQHKGQHGGMQGQGQGGLQQHMGSRPKHERGEQHHAPQHQQRGGGGGPYRQPNGQHASQPIPMQHPQQYMQGAPYPPQFAGQHYPGGPMGGFVPHQHPGQPMSMQAQGPHVMQFPAVAFGSMGPPMYPTYGVPQGPYGMAQMYSTSPGQPSHMMAHGPGMAQVQQVQHTPPPPAAPPAPAGPQVHAQQDARPPVAAQPPAPSAAPITPPPAKPVAQAKKALTIKDPKTHAAIEITKLTAAPAAPAAVAVAAPAADKAEAEAAPPAPAAPEGGQHRVGLAGEDKHYGYYGHRQPLRAFSPGLRWAGKPRTVGAERTVWPSETNRVVVHMGTARGSGGCWTAWLSTNHVPAALPHSGHSAQAPCPSLSGTRDQATWPCSCCQGKKA